MNNPPAHLSHPKYRADIDGLRAIAVLAVVGFHAFPDWIKGGFIGVDIFFVISGFLISTILFENLEKDTFSFRGFYARRIKRIFPALLVVLISCFTFGWFALLTDEYKQLGRHIAGGAGFVSNFMFWNESGYFDGAADSKPLLHLWSLGIEEQFYIVWPLLLWVAWKKRFNLLSVTLVVALISFALNVRGIYTDAVATFYSPQTRFWELLCGSLLAWVTLYEPTKFEGAKNKLDVWLDKFVYRSPKTSDGCTLSNVQAMLGALLIAYGVYKLTKGAHFPGAWALVPTAGTVLLISAGTQAWINRVVLSNRVLVWFGLISFPLYLWHWPLLSFLRIVEGEKPGRTMRIAAVGVAVLLAWLTYKLIEKPVRLGGHTKAKTVSLAVFMMVVGYAGYDVYARDGYEFRAAIEKYKNNKNELIAIPAKPDESCLDYVKDRSPLFPYCKFTNMGASTTVAVIGDSHAYVAYSGIAELLKKQSINTVLLANSGCPPFMGAAYGENESAKEDCGKRIDQLIQTVLSKNDIKKVFIFSRGAVYITGKYYGEAEIGTFKEPPIPAMIFKQSLQNTIDMLKESGKDVYYISENPELRTLPNACVPRPLRTTEKNCEMDLSAVKARQEKYLEIVRQLKNVVVLDTLSHFCKNEKCSPTIDGNMLYSDYDHLSVAGSRFQARSVLGSHLLNNSN